jgi:hypothetical protein
MRVTEQAVIAVAVAIRRVAGEASFTKKCFGFENSDYHLAPASRHDSELNSAIANKKHRLGGFSLDEDFLSSFVFLSRSSIFKVIDECLKIKAS